VVGAGCGSRKFEQNLPHRRDSGDDIHGYVVGGKKAVKGSLPWQV
jgi:hypothetical protein